MTNVQVSQTSTTAGNEAKSHTCTMNSGRGLLLSCLLLPGSHGEIVKEKLIPRLLDAWMCLESGQRSQSHTALLFEGFLSNNAPTSLADYQPENDEYAQQKTAC